jgi:hypothetical protein
MSRRLRVSTGGYAYHVLNRAVGKMRIFAKQRDFEAFEEVIQEVKERLPMRVLAWCVADAPYHYQPPGQFLILKTRRGTLRYSVLEQSATEAGNPTSVEIAV